MSQQTVSVLVPVAVPGAYSYRAPEGVTLAPGMVVQVPLGSRQVIGAVWDGEPPARIDPRKLRDVTGVFDVPPLSADIRRFVDWVARWTLGPPGMVLRMVLRTPEAFEAEPPVKGVRRVGPPPERVTKARTRLLEITADGLAWSKSGLAAAAGVSPSVIDGLIAAGTLQAVDLPAAPPAAPPDPEWNPTALNLDQADAAAELVERVKADGFSVTLLDGVTGSGKTEVYFEAVAEAVRAGRQALVLLPEIALTAEFLDRFEGLKFGIAR